MKIVALPRRRGWERITDGEPLFCDYRNFEYDQLDCGGLAEFELTREGKHIAYLCRVCLSDFVDEAGELLRMKDAGEVSGWLAP